MLRPYQVAAHDAAIAWIKKSIEPVVIEAETGSGKSHIIAAISRTFFKMSGKHVLCTAPAVELVQQNAEKYKLIGEQASIFSASIEKSLRYPVIFGTPGTIKNSIWKFCDKFGLVIIDECHGITPTIRHIIMELRLKNPMLRVIGLSATPYRLGTGYIYAIDENNNPCPADSCKSPYFKKKIFAIGGRQLISEGYLTAPVIGSIHGDHYDTMFMKTNSMGKFAQSDIDRAYHGQGRKTARIIADIVEQAKNRNGVMIFAATVKHAKECLESLPSELSAIVTADTAKEDRKKILKDFKNNKIKYLVNISVLTTGFDAPHIDVIALLRATESIGLLKQMIGRGMRLHDGKKDCLILDYGENIKRHCPDSDIFDPKITVFKDKNGDNKIEAACELCGVVNIFAARENKEGFGYDENGYFIDLNGNRILNDYGHIPAHYGRRCFGLVQAPGGTLEQCSYRWTFKKCPECDAENDIAARHCINCKGEIIDPGRALVIEYKKMRKDPYIKQVDAVLSWIKKKTLSKKGNECLQVDYVTEHRTFSVWYIPKGDSQFLIKEYNNFMIATKGGDVMPQTITYQKQTNGFYRIFGYNEQLPEVPQDKRMAS